MSKKGIVLDLMFLSSHYENVINSLSTLRFS